MHSKSVKAFVLSVVVEEREKEGLIYSLTLCLCHYFVDSLDFKSLLSTFFPSNLQWFSNFFYFCYVVCSWTW